MYRQIFLSAAAKNPTLIDFFDNQAKIEIYKRLFNYLLNIKMPGIKIEIPKIEEIYSILDNYKSILEKETQDPFIIETIYKKIAEKISIPAL